MDINNIQIFICILIWWCSISLNFKIKFKAFCPFKEQSHKDSLLIIYIHCCFKGIAAPYRIIKEMELKSNKCRNCRKKEQRPSNRWACSFFCFIFRCSPTRSNRLECPELVVEFIVRCQSSQQLRQFCSSDIFTILYKSIIQVTDYWRCAEPEGKAFLSDQLTFFKWLHALHSCLQLGQRVICYLKKWEAKVVKI